MPKKILKIKLLEDDSILFDINDEEKFNLSVDKNEISGEEIYKLLDVHYDDEFEILPIDDNMHSSKRYSSYQLIYQLFESIVTGIKTKEEDMNFEIEDLEYSLMDDEFIAD